MKRLSRLFIVAVSIALGATACTNAPAPRAGGGATGGAVAALRRGQAVDDAEQEPVGHALQRARARSTPRTSRT